MAQVVRYSETRTLIFGASGNLGRSLYFRLGENEGGAIARNREHGDLATSAELDSWFMLLNPSLVINCVGVSSVAKARQDPQGCWQSNVVALARLAEACSRWRIPLICFSSADIFASATARPEAGYSLQDIPKPANMLGISRLAGEHAVLSRASLSEFPYWILRLGKIVGYREPGAQDPLRRIFFSDRRLDRRRQAVGVLSRGRASWTFAEALLRLLITWVRQPESRPKPGIYHAVSSGHSTLFELADAASRKLPEAVPVKPADRSAEDPEDWPDWCALQPSETLGEIAKPWPELLHSWCADPKSSTPALEDAPSVP